MTRRLLYQAEDVALSRAFQQLPNIGPAMAADLIRLGVKSVKDLARRDPLAMYNQLARLDGVRHDPCVLDTFMAVVDHAKTGSKKPWWTYTAERKRLMASGKGAARRRA